MMPGPGMCRAGTQGEPRSSTRWLPGADDRARPGYEAGLTEKCFVVTRTQALRFIGKPKPEEYT